MDPQGRLQDELLVVRCMEGEARAFSLLVGRWQQRFLRYALRLVQDRDAVADLVQETWLGIIQGLSGLNDPACFRGWAYRILTNKCRDWIRRQQRRRSAMDEVRREPREQQTPVTVEAERTDLLENALAVLPRQQRTAVTLFYLEGLTMTETAEVESVPVGTIKSRLSRARDHLRQFMEEQGHEYFR